MMRFAPLLLAALPTFAAAQDTGAYLAGRQAAADNQFATAAQMFDRAIRAEPGDKGELHLRASYLHAVTDDLARAARDAQAAAEADMATPFSQLIALVGDAHSGNWQGLLDAQEAGRFSSPPVDLFAKAWAYRALGQMEQSGAAFDDIIATQGLEALGSHHKAMSLAAAGDLEGALTLLESPVLAQSPSRNAIISRVQVLAGLERWEDARKLLTDSFGQEPQHADLQALLLSVVAGQPVPLTGVIDAPRGLAEALVAVGDAHLMDDNPRMSLLHARLALALHPNDAAALLTSGQSFMALERPDAAARDYESVPADNPARSQADLGRARALEAAGDRPGAIAAMEDMSTRLPDSGDVWNQLGNLYAQDDRHEDAITALTRAIELTAEGTPGLWVRYYARAISYHEANRWTEAEADFRTALDLEPDQPNVLNYLGYSLVERGEKLEEALEMIQRAVARAPNNGAIVDSLAWALFRLGRVEEAVAPMERAAQLMATDPIVNDHLGDVLWTVGRRDEALYQWQRALSFDPEPDLADQIRDKLENGLTPGDD